SREKPSSAVLWTRAAEPIAFTPGPPLTPLNPVAAMVSLTAPPRPTIATSATSAIKRGRLGVQLVRIVGVLIDVPLRGVLVEDQDVHLPRRAAIGQHAQIRLRPAHGARSIGPTGAWLRGVLLHPRVDIHLHAVQGLTASNRAECGNPHTLLGCDLTHAGLRSGRRGHRICIRLSEAERRGARNGVAQRRVALEQP